LIATYLKDEGDWTVTPVFECAGNRWITLDLKTGERLNRTTRAFPQGRSVGGMYDPQAKPHLRNRHEQPGVRFCGSM
jgi:hypothetical protein